MLIRPVVLLKISLDIQNGIQIVPKLSSHNKLYIINILFGTNK